MSTTTGVYVPPHLRDRSTQPAAGPSRITSRNASPNGQPNHTSSPSRTNQSLPNRPWSSRNDASTSTIRPPSNEPYDATRPYSNSAPSPRRAGHSGSPTLYVYGDSFTGPLKLISEESVKVMSFKGASAKGLNNPNSIKQVSRDLLPSVNSIMAPPPYVYTSSAGRWALFIFGNVDLQINYLWQLQHKPITAESFPAETNFDQDESMDDCPHAFGPNVLASATETSLTGPALGPELFVERIIKGYTAWLEREIVNGPIGQRIRERAQDTTSIRRKTPGKVLIAAALPPLVDDATLPRIPEKYVDRLEEDHAKTQRALEREDRADRIERRNSIEEEGFHSKTPWARSRSGSPNSSISAMEDIQPSSPKSTASSSWSSESASQLASSTNTSITTPPSSSPSSKRVSTPSPASVKDEKKTIESLLSHDPPLCTLGARIEMTNRYNSLLKAFCEEHSDILGFVDITPSILAGNSPDSAETTLSGSADRTSWACPVDPTNIHPLWEPTLPLWKDEMAKHGVPTQSYCITEDAEETFKAYEADKRKRTASGFEARIKIRDE